MVVLLASDVIGGRFAFAILDLGLGDYSIRLGDGDSPKTPPNPINNHDEDVEKRGDSHQG